MSKSAESPWSAVNPALQLAWDGVSLSALMECPEYYNLTIRQGWRKDETDLIFGICFASSMETFRRARCAGKTKTEATDRAVQTALASTGTHYWYCDMCGTGVTLVGEPVPKVWPCNHQGDSELLCGFKPWGGRYLDGWRCTHDPSYWRVRGANGKIIQTKLTQEQADEVAGAVLCSDGKPTVERVAGTGKCLWARQVNDGDDPGTCGSCGNPTVAETVWVSENTVKDRYTLVRLVIWWCDDQPEDWSKDFHTYIFPNGEPAIEVPLRMPLLFKASTGESFTLCGHADEFVTDGQEMFIKDDKTTKKTLSRAFFEGYAPHVGLDTYDLLGSILYPSLEFRGLLISGAQTMVNGARFAMQPSHRTEDQREEWLKDIQVWIETADAYARANHWPMAKANCWKCIFKGICSKDPAVRERYLKADFYKHPWNPLEER